MEEVIIFDGYGFGSGARDGYSSGSGCGYSDGCGDGRGTGMGQGYGYDYESPRGDSWGSGCGAGDADGRGYDGSRVYPDYILKQKKLEGIVEHLIVKNYELYERLDKSNPKENPSP